MLRILVFSIVLASTWSALSDQNDVDEKRARVFIFLEEPSLSESLTRYVSRHNEKPNRVWQQQRTAQLDEYQAQVRNRIDRLVVKEHSALTTAVNGFRATVERRHIKTLQGIEGVKSVTPIMFHDIENFYSVPWVGAPQLWQNSGDGKDITIAVIDTGVDYLHANFGGEGNPDDYADNDFAVIEPDTFPTSKVIGGWDFAGPTYNSREDDEPLPDADPLDGHGHGSHVAGTALGLGVPGTIGPGVAKGAKLLALKVFSDIGGSTDLTVDAIDRALDPNGDGSMDDHVDVINMSLGARFGLPTDVSAIAAGNAMNAGIIVVASAGNNGDIPYVIGSPGISPEIITVAASISGGRRQIALASNLTDGPTLLPAIEGSSPVRIGLRPLFNSIVLASSLPAANKTTTVSQETVATESQVNTGNQSFGPSSQACTALTNADEVKGHYVLVSRGSCNFPNKFRTVQEAGAIGIVVINSSDNTEDLFVMGGLDETITIPGLMITATDGQRIVDQLSQLNTPVQIAFGSLFTVPIPENQTDTLADFTSRGPGTADAGFKPSITAPGRYIFSTAAGTGTQGFERRGTSMAAPHVAGMAALLKQQFPNYTPQMIKSLLMNSAATSQRDGPGTDSADMLSRQGLGVLRGDRASSLKAITEPAGLSFGYVNPNNGDIQPLQTFAQTSILRNLTDQAITYQVTHQPVLIVPGVSVVCPNSVTVAAGAQTEFSIELNIDTAVLPFDETPFSLNEVSGWCEFNDGEQSLRTGYMAAVDGASKILPTSNPNALLIETTTPVKTSATESPKSLPKTSHAREASRATLTLQNTSPTAGIARSYLLAAHTDETTDASTSIAAVGWRQSELFTFPLFEIAIAMAQPWENPSNMRWFLYVDTDFDQTYERVLFAVDWSRVGFDPGQILTGIDYIEEFDDVGSEQSVFHWIVEDGDYNDQVIVLPFFNAASGINAIFKPSETAFNFRLVAVDRYDNYSEMFGFIDLTNPSATQQHDLQLQPGESIELPEDTNDQLWLVPTNGHHEQHFIVPATNVDSPAPD